MVLVYILIVLFVYFLSMYFTWKWIHIAHSKEGCYFRQLPDYSDACSVFIPIVNTTTFIYLWIFVSPYRIARDYRKFFDIDLPVENK